MSSRNEMNTISVKPDKTRLQNLLDEIADGAIKVPVFQRDFVWKPAQMIELFDSIIKGYPIGSLLFWRPETEFKTKEYIGPYRIFSKSNNLSYVLDGFQRITTLFGVLSNPKKMYPLYTQDLKDYQIYYDLKEKEFTYLKRKKNNKPYLIPLYKAVDTFEFLDFLREIESEIEDKLESKVLIENAKEISKIFYDYEIPYVEIRGGDIKSAVQIFSRINSTGLEISEDFMLSALSYNIETNFLFSDYITEFINGLNEYNFENLKRDTVLNCISNSKGKIYFDVKIEDLLKPDLESLTISAFPHIRKAVEFLNKKLMVLDVRLLPYPTQLIFISEYFRLNPNATSLDLEGLKKWFWVTTYSNYFTFYSLSQQRTAYAIFVDFALGKHDDGVLKINSDDVFSSAKFPDKLNFTGVRTKALQLFMLNDVYAKRIVADRETIREFSIFNKKDRTPANIILMISSDVDVQLLNNNFSNFINNTSTEVLNQFFITKDLIDLYNSNRIDDFILKREELIIAKERNFVTGLNIKYDI